MKKSILILIIACLCLNIKAQRRSQAKKGNGTYSYTPKKSNTSSKSTRSNNSDDDDEYEATVFVGTHGGIKGHYGIGGLQASYKIANKTHLCGGAGYSFWSTKVGADVQRYTKINRTGFCYGAGAAFAFGGDLLGSSSTQIPYYAYSKVDNTLLGYSIERKAYPILNLIVGYGIRLGARSSMLIQTGYGYKLGSPYKYTMLDPTRTVDEIENDSEFTSQQRLSNILAPHGIITNIGFVFPIF
jgi:hypothetical protein